METVETNVPAAGPATTAPHIARESQRSAIVAKLSGQAMEEPPAEGEAPPEAPQVAVAPPEAPQVAPPAPAGPAAPSPMELNRLMEEHRYLRQRLLEERDRPKQDPIDYQAKAAADAIARKDYEALQRMGLDLNEWAEKQVDDAIDPAAAKVRKLEQDLAEMRQWKAQQEQEAQRQEQLRQEQQLQQQQNEIMGDISRALESDPELQILALAGREKEIYHVMAQYAYATQQQSLTGKAEYLPPEQAARIVLQRENAKLQQLFEHARQLPSYASYFAPPQQAAPAAPAAPRVASPSPVAPGVQLSHNQTSGVDAPRELTRDERRAQIIANLTTALR